MYTNKEKRNGWQQVVVLLFLFLVGGSVSVWGQLPYGCNYEINMQWQKADMERSAAYKAGAITYDSGKGDKAIIIQTSYKFWIHGKNIDDYYRLMVTQNCDPDLYFDNVSITHSEKVPLWVPNNSWVDIYLIGTSTLTARGSGDAGIEMSYTNSRIKIENYSNGKLIINSGSSDALSGGHFTMNSGEVVATGAASGIYCTTFVMNGGKVASQGNTNQGMYIVGDMTINGGEIRAATNGTKDESYDIYAPNTLQTGGYVELNGSKCSLGTGKYEFQGGTMVATKTLTAPTKCKDFWIKGGSVIVNTPDLRNAPTITDGTNSVYRVKVRGWGLSDGVDYNCVINGRSFKSRTVNGYFHFWLPATTPSITVNGVTIPIDQITQENLPTWNEDFADNKRKNEAPMVTKEVNSSDVLINRYFNFPDAFSGVASGNTLRVHYSHVALCDKTLTSTKNSTLDFNGWTLTGSGRISVTGGLLSLLDASTGTKGGTSMPVEATNGNVRMKELSKVPVINDLKIDGTFVWWGQIKGTTWSNLQNMQQSASRSLTLNRHYFIDPDGSMYCWLDNTKNALTFETGTLPRRYYYTSDPNPATKHGQLLTADTYKASISTGTEIRYKTMSEAFSVATTGQSIRLLEDFAPVSETVALTPRAGEVTFDLQGFKYGGTKTLNANGSRLILTSTDGQGNNLINGKLEGVTHLQGLVYSDMPGMQLGGEIKRNNKTVYRYFAHKVLTANRVTYAWSNDQMSDEAMISGGKACLWLPSGNEATGTVSLGYSGDMTTDKCGELLKVPPISIHSSSVELVHPYLNLVSLLKLDNKDGHLSVTHNDVTVDDFLLNQQVVVYGTGTKGITVADGATVQRLLLRNLLIGLGGSNDYAPIRVGAGATLSLYLTGTNTLQGGGQGSNVKAGIEVAASGHLHIYNDDSDDTRLNGTGQLFVKGGSHIANAAAGIGGSYGQAAGAISIHGGSIQAQGGLASCWGIGNGAGLAADAVRPEVRILGGSLKTNREWIADGVLKQPFKNNLNGEDKDLYLMTVNTSLSPRKKYLCIHPGVSDAFPAMTDEFGKYYFWIPQLTQEVKPTAIFTDPATSNSTTIQLVKIDPNDKNVAPIVCELEVEGKGSVYYNNLKDAFDAVPSDKPTRATIRLLTDIDNLSTTQVVKRGNNVTLNLDRFNLDTKNSNSAGFEAQVGGYLFVTGTGIAGTGNIKSTFNIGGDIYIAGIVPLTDATPLQNGKAVFRTLVKDLPDNPSNAYTYSYSNTSNRTFYLHDGMACLWLPDASGQLTFRVTQGSNVTEYTAGTITTNTQRTEPLGCQAVGVIARVIKGESVRDFNSLPDAFAAAAEAEGNTVQLLANVSLTQPVTIGGVFDFTINLNGMTLAASTGTKLTVASGRYLTVTDQNTGTKGNLKMDILLEGRLLVSGHVSQSGNVSTVASPDNYLWRTIADVSNLAVPPTVVTLTEGSAVSKVLNNEACFWLTNGNTQDFTFVADKDYRIEDVNINANHQDNLVTLGVGNEQARIGATRYATFAGAWAAALSQGGADIVLLKDATIAGSLTLDGNKNVSVDVARYSLGTSADNLSVTVTAGSTLLVNSSNGTGRMLVPIVNQGILYVGSGIRADYLSREITDGSSLLWRTLATNLPDGMPDDAVYTFSYGNTEPQTGSFYVKHKTACLWLKERKAETLTFGQFNSYTDNVTVEPNHANQVLWGQNNVAQVGSTLYAELDKAFSENRNQAVILLKSAVLKIQQQIDSEMQLKMEGHSISPASSEIMFLLGQTESRTGSLRVEGTGNITTNFQILRSDAARISGSNANLLVSENLNLNAAMVQEGTTSYYRTTVTLPTEAEGEMTYMYGNQTGQVRVIKDEPLCLWFMAQGKAQELRFTSPEGIIYSAANVLVQAHHVNPVSVELIMDEASIDGKYHKTLSEAFGVARANHVVRLERDLSAMTKEVSVTAAVEGTVTLDLNGHVLTGSGTNAALKGNSSKGYMLVKNGTLSGTLLVDQNLFVHTDVNMNSLMASDGTKTVWRTLVQLSETVRAGDEIEYSFGGDQPVRSANIQIIDGKVFVCLWLPSSNLARTMVVKAGMVEYALNGVIIASTHGNELDFTSGNAPVASIGDKNYASLASALASALDGETVKLLKELSLSTVQDVKTAITLDLTKKNLTSSNGGFNVAGGKTLTLVNGGALVGTIRLIGEGATFAGKGVKIVGIVLNAKNEEQYRVLATMATTPEAITQCLWLKSATLEYDYPMTESGNTWEVTIPAKLNNHNEELTAHRRIEFAVSTSGWQTEYVDANIVLKPAVIWTLPAGLTTATIHRLTLHDGAWVKLPSSSQVTAEEGIRYIRCFDQASVWESIALPFSSTRVTAEKTAGTVSLLTPASGTGTEGDFWLYTMQVNGQQIPVNGEQMEANEAYIMAVPPALAGKELTFVSAPRQVLRRNQVQAVVPVSGFASYANGTLDEITVKDRCYVLNTLGTLFKRQEVNYTLPPFRGYLLADMATTNNTPELRMGIATDVPEIEAVDGSLVVRSLPGRLLVDSPRKTWLSVYTFTGYRIYQLRIPEGHTEIPMERGAYIVNGQKLLIR